MIGDYNSAKPYLYTDKLAGSTKACVGFVVDSVQGRYVPNTLLKGDIRSNVKGYARVIAVFRKNTCASNYSELTYMTKNVECEKINLPQEYKYLAELFR